MFIDPRLQQFLFRAYVPFTFFVLGLRLGCHWLLRSNLPLWLSPWASSLIGFVDFAATPAGWICTGYLVGHRVAPPVRWIFSFLPRLYEWLTAVIPPRHPHDRVSMWLPGVLIFVLTGWLLGTTFSLYSSPLLFWMVNVVLLTCSIVADGAYTKFCAIIWPELRVSFQRRAFTLRAEHDARKAIIQVLGLEGPTLERLLEEEDFRFEQALLRFYDTNNP